MSGHIYTRLKVSETHGVKLCLFDKEGAELYDRYTWCVVIQQGVTCYLQRHETVNGVRKTIKFHRELLGLKDDEIYDHRNRNGLDNRLCNLRPSTIQENNYNRGLRSDNKSGVKGVYWREDYKKWAAQVNNKHLGYFSDIKEAESVVRAKREELHGEFCNHG